MKRFLCILTSGLLLAGALYATQPASSTTVNVAKLASHPSSATASTPLFINPSPTTLFALAPSLLPSPTPTINFLALADNGTGIPPDCSGTVGPNHVVTMLNTQMRIQTRAGSALSTVSLDQFWSSLQPSSTFDPHITYDPFNDRWIASTLGDSKLGDSLLLVGVSATGNPLGNWYLYKINVGSGTTWADYDALGFNKNWIVVSANLFDIHGTYTGDVGIWVFDKADLYANGTGSYTFLPENSGNAFTMVPVTSYDNTLDTLYLIEDWDGSQGKLRISTITGSVGSETLTPGIAFPTTSERWDSSSPQGDFAPQLGISIDIDAGDSRIQNAIYRNGSIWCAHTVYLPASAPTHTAAQWWQVTSAGTVQQFGRLEDPTATQFFAYPTIAVNANNDALLGYSRFGTNQYASANYAYRAGTDSPGTLRADTVFKSGEGPYYKTFSGGSNRWGDFSSTAIDPADDLSFWTLQEYAATPTGNPATDGAGNWGTWWAQIQPDTSATNITIQITRPADQMSYPTGSPVTITVTANDTLGTITNLTIYIDSVPVTVLTNAPYQTTWTPPTNGTHFISATAFDNLGLQRSAIPITIVTGDAKSPLGIWQTMLGGFDRGLAYISCNDDFTLTGYAITTRSFGLLDITGTWNYDAKHNLTGTYTETLNGTNYFTGTFTGKTTPGKKLSLKPFNVWGIKRSINAVPNAALANITGVWNATVLTGKTVTTETYTITATADPGLYTITGSVTGQLLLNSRNAVTAFMSDGITIRALTGKLTTTGLSLSGQNNAAERISIRALH